MIITLKKRITDSNGRITIDGVKVEPGITRKRQPKMEYGLDNAVTISQYPTEKSMCSSNLTITVENDYTNGSMQK